MNFFRIFGMAVGVIHIGLLVFMFEQFKTEFISEKLEEIPMFKLGMTTIVLCEIVSALFYVISMYNNNPPLTACVIAMCITSIVGWALVYIFPYHSEHHVRGVPVFCAGTAGYTICMVVITIVKTKNPHLRWIFICIFTTMYSITLVFVITFLAENNVDNTVAILFEWTSFISLGVNFFVFFMISPYVPDNENNEDTTGFIALSKTNVNVVVETKKLLPQSDAL